MRSEQNQSIACGGHLRIERQKNHSLQETAEEAELQTNRSICNTLDDKSASRRAESKAEASNILE